MQRLPDSDAGAALQGGLWTRSTSTIDVDDLSCSGAVNAGGLLPTREDALRPPPSLRGSCRRPHVFRQGALRGRIGASSAACG